MDTETKDSVFERVSNIKNQTRDELLDVWQKAYRKPAPKGISRRILELAAAYHIQEQAFGGLPPNTKLKLKRYSYAPSTKAKSSKITDGTIFVREWNGVIHRVEAVDGKFMWSQKIYNSLSEIARMITGTRWSGPRFFGLGVQSNE